MNTNTNSRAVKRVKLSPSIQSIGRYDTTRLDKSLITALNVSDNDTLETISNYKNLTILNLDETNVKTIQSCPNLFSLNIATNTKMKCIKIASVQFISLKDMSDLRELELINAKHVNLHDLPKLHSLHLPSAFEVTISSFSIRHLKLPNAIPRVQELTLMNIQEDIDATTFEGTYITKLVLDNCDIKHVSGLDTFEEVIIRNCKYLRSIENISNVDRLTVFNCSQLFNLDTIFNISNLSVTQCSALTRIKNIEASAVSIHYCFGIITLHNLSTETLDVAYCPSLERLCITPDTKYLSLTDCAAFETLMFSEMLFNDNDNSAFCFSDLQIEMHGDNMVETIKDWYVATLTIANNRSLEKIANLHNIVNLIIRDCSELHSVSNAFVKKSILLESCPSLEVIANVYGFNTLVLTQCDMLSYFDTFDLSNLKTIRIISCPELSLRFDGKILTELVLYDTGSIFIKNLSKHSTIDIQNVPFLPDVTTSLLDADTPLEDEEPIYAEAIALSIHMQKLLDAIRLIESQICTFNTRRKYLMYRVLKEEDKIIDCVICHDAILPAGWTMTNCNHLFHSGCLRSWLSVKRSCPLCNQYA